MKLNVLTGVAGLVILVAILELVRRRQLREKYAILWILVGVVVVLLAFFPRLLDRLAGTLGVVSGVSLVLFLGVVFLLLVSLHLSWEVNRLEEETRTLAESLTLIRTQLDLITGPAAASLDSPTPPHSPVLPHSPVPQALADDDHR
jgi:hypothetical protein